LGALPLGAASDGATYSLSFSCEYPTKPAIPINTHTQDSSFILIIALLSHVRESSQTPFPLSLVAKRLINSAYLQLKSFHAFPRPDAEAINFIELNTILTSNRCRLDSALLLWIPNEFVFFDMIGLIPNLPFAEAEQVHHRL
jgi:hypothetical protein